MAFITPCMTAHTWLVLIDLTILCNIWQRQFTNLLSAAVQAASFVWLRELGFRTVFSCLCGCKGRKNDINGGKKHLLMDRNKVRWGRFTPRTRKFTQIEITTMQSANMARPPLLRELKKFTPKICTHLFLLCKHTWKVHFYSFTDVSHLIGQLKWALTIFKWIFSTPLLSQSSASILI